MQLLSQSYSHGVAEWLASDNSAHVLSSFERACNLIDEQGRFISIVDNTAGNGPFAMVLMESPGSLERIISVGDSVTVGENSLTIDTTTIDFSGATVWCPRLDWDRAKDCTYDFFKNVCVLNMIVQYRASQNSLSSMLFSTSHNTDFVCAKVADSAQQLFRGILNANTQSVQAGASGMAGLGVGLTPAGDDFLMGVIYALWAISDSEDAISWSRTIVDAASPRTTMLSAAMLQEASNGRATEHWHVLVDVLGKGDTMAMDRACMGILSVGNTSGADALTGFLLSIDFLRDYINIA